MSNKKMIVKIQLPLNEDAPYECFVYNEDRSFETLLPITDDLIEWMNGKVKQFFYAHIEKETLILDGVAEWQEW